MNNNKNLCDDLKTTTAVNTLAVLISSKFDNPDNLALFATILGQISATLAFIAAKQLIKEDKIDKEM